jgi:magnesium-protoporphyrin IX monomethyl ester (oxidative) cyclase
MHEAMGFDPTEYDMTVFRITSEISRQVFPLSLDIDHPAFRAGLDRLCRISAAADRAKAQGGVVGAVKRAGLAVAGAAVFARLYVLPAKGHALPERIRMAPAW